MKTWMKVAIGTLVGTAIGVAVSIFGKAHNEDEELVMIDDEAETYDSDSDEEAE